jgi:uncharacterized protein (TIGR00661 family)
MKILYAIQGTGNGHLSRARDIIPILKNKGELDILVSGTQADLSLPFPVKYTFKGLSFIFGKKGGVDLWNTYLKNNMGRILREIRSVPVENYDLIINDFEPVSAWAAYFKGIPCIGLSHQSAVLSENAFLPKHKDRVGKFILKNYAPTKVNYGFHFEKFNKHTFTPVIRKQVRELEISDRGHYTVYLPSYSDENLIKTLGQFKGINWQVFSKHNKNVSTIKNVSLRPIDNKAFIESMASCIGVLCGAGFETPAEALFLNKKLMVIPMKNQYEQHCNAAALLALGVPVLKNLKKKQVPKIESWLNSKEIVKVNFPDITENIIDLIIENHLISELIDLNDPLPGNLNSI